MDISKNSVKMELLEFYFCAKQIEIHAYKGFSQMLMKNMHYDKTYFFNSTFYKLFLTPSW